MMSSSTSRPQFKKVINRRNFHKLRAAVHHALVKNKDDTDLALIEELRNEVRKYSSMDMCPFQCMRLRDALDEFEEQLKGNKCEKSEM